MLQRFILSWICFIGFASQAAVAALPEEPFAKLAKRIEAVPLLYVIPPNVKAEIDSINSELGKYSSSQWIEIAKKLPSLSIKTRAFILDNVFMNKRVEVIPYLVQQYDKETDPFCRDHICKVIAHIDFEHQTMFLMHVLNDSSPWARAAVLNSMIGKKVPPEMMRAAINLLSNDPDPIVRSRAVFAVAESGELNSRAVLEKSLKTEKDSSVRLDIQSALKAMR